jgi:P27 family predicted phage terminase small subunit
LLACPDYLDGIARKLWSKLARELFQAELLTALDGQTLAIACQAFATWQEHEQKVREQGALVKSGNGSATTHPSVAIARNAAEQWRKYAAELGLTPAARVRLKKRPKKQAGPANLWEGLLANGN